jgi:hypothetical protein
VRVIRSKMRWPELVARITAMLHNILVGKSERNRPHWGSRRRWRGNIKTDATCIGLDGNDTYDGPLVGVCKSDNELLGYIKGREIWSVWLTVSFPRRTPLSRIGYSKRCVRERDMTVLLVYSNCSWHPLQLPCWLHGVQLCIQPIK